MAENEQWRHAFKIANGAIRDIEFLTVYEHLEDAVPQVEHLDEDVLNGIHRKVVSLKAGRADALAEVGEQMALAGPVREVRGALENLAKNYETRVEHTPKPDAKWADVAADVRRILALVPAAPEGRS